MLYTVVPLERIYVPREKELKSFEKTGQDNQVEYKEIFLDFGRVIARREDNQYYVERMESTDMSDYLKSEYRPGSMIEVIGK